LFSLRSGSAASAALARTGQCNAFVLTNAYPAANRELTRAGENPDAGRLPDTNPDLIGIGKQLLLAS
jgi:hypothetical protein